MQLLDRLLHCLVNADNCSSMLCEAPGFKKPGQVVTGAEGGWKTAANRSVWAKLVDSLEATGSMLPRANLDNAWRRLQFPLLACTNLHQFCNLEDTGREASQVLKTIVHPATDLPKT